MEKPLITENGQTCVKTESEEERQIIQGYDDAARHSKVCSKAQTDRLLMSRMPFTS